MTRIARIAIRTALAKTPTNLRDFLTLKIQPLTSMVGGFFATKSYGY